MALVPRSSAVSQATGVPAGTWSTGGTWSPGLFRAAPLVVVGLFAAVTALRWLVDGSGQAAALLYVVPIALSALAFGRRGGIAAAASGAALFVLLALVHGRGDLDVTGWAAPVVAMALVGALLGELAERAARARGFATRHAERSRRLEELCERQQAALVVSDSLVQTIAAARWMLEAGATEQAIEVLTASVSDGIDRLHATLGEEPGMSPSGALPRRGVPETRI